MSKEDNGGPAFPCPQDSINQNVPSLGMTLRDYLAAKAMQGICVSEELRFTSAERIAGMSYQIADAMLEARKK